MEFVTNGGLHMGCLGCLGSLVHNTANTLKQSTTFQSISSESFKKVQLGLGNSGIPVQVNQSTVSNAQVHNLDIRRQEAIDSFPRLPALTAAIKQQNPKLCMALQLTDMGEHMRSFLLFPVSSYRAVTQNVVITDMTASRSHSTTVTTS